MTNVLRLIAQSIFLYQKITFFFSYHVSSPEYPGEHDGSIYIESWISDNETLFLSLSFGYFFIVRIRIRLENSSLSIFPCEKGDWHCLIVFQQISDTYHDHGYILMAIGSNTEKWKKKHLSIVWEKHMFERSSDLERIYFQISKLFQFDSFLNTHFQCEISPWLHYSLFEKLFVIYASWNIFQKAHVNTIIITSFN